MTCRQRMVLRLLPLLAAVPIFEAAAHGQAARVDPYQNGAAPALPGRSMAAANANTNTTAAQAAAAGYVNPMVIDPMAASYMYGPGIPMTRGQVGLSALSSMQQFTGLGSGRISGVRGTPGVEAPRSAAHTRDPNIPGGQAARYFNRLQPRGFGAAAAPAPPAATTIAAGNSRKFYQRESRYFPQPAR